MATAAKFQTEAIQFLFGILFLIAVNYFRNRYQFLTGNSPTSSMSTVQSHPYEGWGDLVVDGPEWRQYPLNHSIQSQLLDKTSIATQVVMQQQEGQTFVVGTTVLSNFFQSRELLERLRNPEIWKTCDDKFGWMEINAEPRNVWEDIAVQIWNSSTTLQHLAHGRLLERSVGFEYWCNVLTSEYPLGWHVDKDENAARQFGKVVNPTMGSVYYGFPHSGFSGGYLETIHGNSRLIDPYQVNGEIERIRPEYNRLVLLNVSEWHRVSPIFGTGERYALAVNLWHERPMAFANSESNNQ